MVKEALCFGERRVVIRELYSLLNFTVKLKLLLKNKAY